MVRAHYPVVDIHLIVIGAWLTFTAELMYSSSAHRSSVKFDLKVPFRLEAWVVQERWTKLTLDEFAWRGRGMLCEVHWHMTGR